MLPFIPSTSAVSSRPWALHRHRRFFLTNHRNWQAQPSTSTPTTATGTANLRIWFMYSAAAEAEEVSVVVAAIPAAQEAPVESGVATAAARATAVRILGQE